MMCAVRGIKRIESWQEQVKSYLLMAPRGTLKSRLFHHKSFTSRFCLQKRVNVSTACDQATGQLAGIRCTVALLELEEEEEVEERSTMKRRAKLVMTSWPSAGDDAPEGGDRRVRMACSRTTRACITGCSPPHKKGSASARIRSSEPSPSILQMLKKTL
jgi:hypothetical protein